MARAFISYSTKDAPIGAEIAAATAAGHEVFKDDLGEERILAGDDLVERVHREIAAETWSSRC